MPECHTCPSGLKGDLHSILILGKRRLTELSRKSMYIFVFRICENVCLKLDNPVVEYNDMGVGVREDKTKEKCGFLNAQGLRERMR